MPDITVAETAELQPDCKSCIFMEEGPIDKLDVTNRQYFCKRFPPIPLVVPGGLDGTGRAMVQITNVFASTQPDAWCGEWSDDSMELNDIPEPESEPEPEQPTGKEQIR